MSTPPLPPLPQTPPSLAPVEQGRKDAEQLRLLWIFHFIFGGMALLGIGFIAMHYVLMKNIFSNPGMWNGRQQQQLPPEVFQIFMIIYAIAGFFILVGATLNTLSAVFIRGRKYRMFSLVVAAIDCLQVPFGTALGICTFLVLMRESVRKVYESPAGIP